MTDTLLQMTGLAVILLAGNLIMTLLPRSRGRYRKPVRLALLGLLAIFGGSLATAWYLRGSSHGDLAPWLLGGLWGLVAVGAIFAALKARWN